MHGNPLALVAAMFLALAAGACTSTRLIEDQLSTPESIQSLALGTVRFDYTTWTNLDPKDLDRAREYEASWIKVLGDAFLASATSRGLARADSPRTSIDITVTDMDPGSQAARYWLGFGAGAGRISVSVGLGAHGSFRMDGKVSGGMWGGTVEDALVTLGKAIAGHLDKRMHP